MYIADAWNNRICKVSSTGVITTIAGTGVAGFSGDGGHASAAQLSKPTDVAIDAAGNVYISDQQNDCVRKINAAGIISTYAGMGGMAGYSGDGGQATVASINYCEYIQLYDGNLYLGDKLNNVIRQVNTSGIITTFAGNGIGGYSDDGGPATSAEFYYPEAITFDICGNMYISDWYNNRIRKIPSLTTSSEQGCNSSQGIEDFTNGNNIAIYPNPSADIIKIEVAAFAENTVYKIYNIMGQEVKSGSLMQTSNQISLQDLANGIYTVLVAQKDNVSTSKIVIQK